MIPGVWVGVAAAAPLPGDLQARLCDDAIDVAASVIEDLVPEFFKAERGAPVGCWYRVGILVAAARERKNTGAA